MKREAALGALIALAIAALLWVTLGRPSREDGVAAAPARAEETGVGAPAGVQPAATRTRERAFAAEPGEPPPAPAGPAPSSGEPTGRELEQLQVEVPFGTLEVLVLEGRQPLAGAEVLVHGRIPGGPPPEFDGLRPEYGLSGVTDREGLVVFRGVAADTYSVRVLAPPRTVIETIVVHALNVHRRVLVVYGTGTIHGNVHDEAGDPVADCLVSVSAQHSQLEGQSTWARTMTDPQGAYEAGALLASPVMWVERALDGVRPDESVATSLGVGERKQVDFGYPGGAPRWTGTVRDSSGAPVEFPELFTTRRGENDERGRFKSSGDGSFDVPMQPGTYAISTRGYTGVFGIGEVIVGPNGLQQDLTLPGTRLEVEVSHSGAGADSAGVLDRVQVWLTRPGTPGRMSDAAAGDRRSFTAVPPGEYQLSTHPNPLIGVNPLPVTIRAGTPLERIRITIADA